MVTMRDIASLSVILGKVDFQKAFQKGSGSLSFLTVQPSYREKCAKPHFSIFHTSSSREETEANIRYVVHCIDIVTKS